MRRPWFTWLLLQLVWLAGADQANAQAPPLRPADDDGFLIVQHGSPGNLHFQIITYQPQPGDILLYQIPEYETLFWMAGSGAPMHAAIVFARPDGRPASLELTGPAFWCAKVCLVDVGPRLKGYAGAIMVRRPRQPLTHEQSAELTRFALAQEGKHFALGRLFLQGTPFRCRYGLRRLYFGQTHLDRPRWICSELVIAAASSAGLLDPKAYPANAMYPRDLAYDEEHDLSAAFGPPLLWVPHLQPASHDHRIWCDDD